MNKFTVTPNLTVKQIIDKRKLKVLITEGMKPGEWKPACNRQGRVFQERHVETSITHLMARLP